MIGSRILDEALRRGHLVTAIVRQPERIATRPGLTRVIGDGTEAASIAATPAEVDLAISAYSPASGSQDGLSKNAHALLAGLDQAGVGRVIVVGVAGTPIWTFVSPAAVIAPGERTGTFRIGGDQFMVDADGESKISAEDYAIAILDEAEIARHPNERISVAY